jgi:hypothetical protein
MAHLRRAKPALLSTPQATAPVSLGGLMKKKKKEKVCLEGLRIHAGHRHPFAS